MGKTWDRIKKTGACLKEIWKREDEQQKDKDKDKDKDKIIYEYWEKVWEDQTGRENENDVFKTVFKGNYDDVVLKDNKNRKKNFRLKKSFVVVLILGFVTFVAMSLWIYLNDGQMVSVIENSIFFVLFLWGAGIINKWLDIKKYQETWVRHSTHKHKMEMEMLRYAEYIGEYNTLDEKKRMKTFMEQIIKIADENQTKFENNMETKEKTLMDFFSQRIK